MFRNNQKKLLFFRKVGKSVRFCSAKSQNGAIFGVKPHNPRNNFLQQRPACEISTVFSQNAVAKPAGFPLFAKTTPKPTDQCTSALAFFSSPQQNVQKTAAFANHAYIFKISPQQSVQKTEVFHLYAYILSAKKPLRGGLALRILCFRAAERRIGLKNVCQIPTNSQSLHKTLRRLGQNVCQNPKNSCFLHKSLCPPAKPGSNQHQPQPNCAKFFFRRTIVNTALYRYTYRYKGALRMGVQHISGRFD